MEIHACTEHLPLPDGEVRLLGASRTVTGAMTRVEIGNRALLIDCGIAQGDEARGWRLPDGAMEVDAIVLTHGHNDHVGSLPEMLERGFNRPIFGTAPTLEIARVVLADGIRLSGGSDADARDFQQRFRALTRAVPYDVMGAHLAGTDVQFAFWEAGHILGSSSVELIGGKSRVICSGDLGRPGSPILRDYNTSWSDELAVDVVVMECTYGDCDHAHTAADIEETLARIITRAVKDGGHILVPAFAIGRTQTLLFHLNNLVERKRIPAIPVAVDTPMGIAITETYQQFRALYDREALGQIARGDNPLDFKSLYAVNKARDSIRLRDVRDPMIIIAGSGMVTGGRIVGHMKELLARRESCVMFVGFQAPGTTGRRIQDAARAGGAVVIDGESVPVRAQVETVSGLSAHADRRELKGWLGKVPRVSAVMLHHGEEAAQRGFARWRG